MIHFRAACYSLAGSRAYTLLAMGLALTFVVFWPEAALAQNPTTFEAGLCTMASWFRGGVGKALATIAVIIMGIGALLGKVSWGMAMIVGVGIAVIFGTFTILPALGADSFITHCWKMDGQALGVVGTGR